MSVCLTISCSPSSPPCLSNCGNRVKALKRNLEGRYQQEGSKTVTASETVNNLSVQPSECMVIRYPGDRVIAGGGCLGVGV